MRMTVQELMVSSGAKFGTSGTRGLADEMTDLVCYVYAKGFLQYLETAGELRKDGTRVAIAGDLRPSTKRIMEAVRRAAADMGCVPEMCGAIPSPAVALYGITHGSPAIMVTGSHIPADRNGIKFNKCTGEILKQDEEGICRQDVEIDDTLCDRNGAFAEPATAIPQTTDTARILYVRRYLDFFPANCLEGLKIGVYQHSAVGRDILLDVVHTLGAEATPLGRSDIFIPVDTEAIRPEDVELAARWSREYGFDAILSTDGDSDRPLVADENGQWLRGDAAGILCADYLHADSISTPVSCNSAVEKCGWFNEVRRTRIGSPYVIASMIEATHDGGQSVVGYEANGGFLTDSDILLEDRVLPALPTRDALILLLCVVLSAKQQEKTVSQVVEMLPARFTASGRLKEFPQEKSRVILGHFSTGDATEDKTRAETAFGDLAGELTGIDSTDGIRMTFANNEVIHLRPSGNAPDFRCYNEADSPERAVELNDLCLGKLREMAEG